MPTTAAKPDTPPEEPVLSPGEIPGPGRMAVFGVVFGFFGGDPLHWLPMLQKRFGKTVRLYLPSEGWTYLITEPDHIQHVLEKNQKNYRKSNSYEQLRRIMGRGLLTSEGDRWLRQHRLMMPMFHRKSVRSFGDMIVDETDRMVERWERARTDGDTIDLLEEMKRITLRIICRALFSSDVDEEDVGDVSGALDVLRREFQAQVRGLSVPEWIPTPHHRRVRKAMDRLDEIVYGMIDGRAGREENYEDFLSMLMLAEDEETGESMSREQIRDEVMTFFLAGHETTANALTWTWYLLSEHPDVHERLHERSRRAFDEHGKAYSSELHEALGYAGQVVDESMRLYPPVPLFARVAEEDDVIGRYEVPAGTTLLLSQYLVHRDPDFWSDPDRFDPTRFEEGRGEDRHRYHYFPFGGGARMCIGRELALLEARLILGGAVRRLRLRRAEPDQPVDVDVAVTLEPDVPLPMHVERW